MREKSDSNTNRGRKKWKKIQQEKNNAPEEEAKEITTVPDSSEQIGATSEELTITRNEVPMTPLIYTSTWDELTITEFETLTDKAVTKFITASTLIETKSNTEIKSTIAPSLPKQLPSNQMDFSSNSIHPRILFTLLIIFVLALLTFCIYVFVNSRKKCGDTSRINPVSLTTLVKRKSRTSRDFERDVQSLDLNSSKKWKMFSLPFSFSSSTSKTNVLNPFLSEEQLPTHNDVIVDLVFTVPCPPETPPFSSEPSRDYPCSESEIDDDLRVNSNIRRKSFNNLRISSVTEDSLVSPSSSGASSMLNHLDKDNIQELNMAVLEDEQ